MTREDRDIRNLSREFCEQATRLIADYLSGELDRRTVEAFESHLSECPDCAAFLATYKKTLGAARALKCEDMPAEIQARLQELLRERIGWGRRKR